MYVVLGELDCMVLCSCVRTLYTVSCKGLQVGIPPMASKDPLLVILMAVVTSCLSLSDYREGGNSLLCFSFLVLQWLMMLCTFSYSCWQFVCILLRNANLDLLPLFQLDCSLQSHARSFCVLGTICIRCVVWDYFLKAYYKAIVIKTAWHWQTWRW